MVKEINVILLLYYSYYPFIIVNN